MVAAGSPGSGGAVDLGLRGSTVVVTGAGSGIGAATARLLGAADVSVVLVGRREALLRQCAGAIEQAGGRAFCVPADLADPASPARIISAARGAFGQLDGLVNNAAVCRHFPLPGWDMAGFDEHLTTNVRAPYFLIQAALPFLRESQVSPVSSFMTGAVIPLDGGQVIPRA